MAALSSPHLPFLKELENGCPSLLGQGRPRGDDNGEGRITVHAMCTLSAHGGVLFVYALCIGRGIVQLP
jgi:hypothetical protein